MEYSISENDIDYEMQQTETLSHHSRKREEKICFFFLDNRVLFNTHAISIIALFFYFPVSLTN